MSIQRLRLTKTCLTSLALVWFFSSMAIQMDFQVIWSCESPITNSTGMRFDVVVYHQVFLVTGCCDKGFLA